MKFFVSFLLLAVLFCGAESVVYPHHLTLKENVFDVHWYVNTTEDRLYFKVVANTTGWAALGLTTNEGGENMKNYDIALGGVRNGNMTYLKDYWSTTEIRPTLDTTQSLTPMSAMESDGKTTLEFNRKADTGDTDQDTPLKNTKIFLAWAIGTEDATDDKMFSQHPNKLGGGRGHTSVGYDMYTGKRFVDPTTKPTTGSVVVPSLVALVVVQLAIIVFK